MAIAAPIHLQDVLAVENQALRPGADFTSQHATELFAKLHDTPQPFSGLCISGGGIRSAIIVPGVIQGLGLQTSLDACGSWQVASLDDFCSQVDRVARSHAASQPVANTGASGVSAHQP